MSKLQRWNILKAFVCIFFAFNIFVGQTNVNKYDIVVTSFVITVIWTKNEQSSWKITFIHFFSVWLSFILFQSQFWYANFDLNISYLKTFSIRHFLVNECSVLLHEQCTISLITQNICFISINPAKEQNMKEIFIDSIYHFFAINFSKFQTQHHFFQIELSYSTQREY